MNETEKLLKKLNADTRQQIERIVLRLYANKFAGLDIKKLKGSPDLYRIRIGMYRIIYRPQAGNNKLVAITRRNEKTYKSF